MQRDGGPGAGGNPTGGSFTGPAEALEIVGDHAYAYSGVIVTGSQSSADASCLKFTTGNYYSLLEVIWFSNNVGNEDKFVDIKLNGASVFKGKYDASPSKNRPFQMIIPSYTEFEFLWGSTTSNEVTVLLAGRIYR